jgi:hypothetical protein
MCIDYTSLSRKQFGLKRYAQHKQPVVTSLHVRHVYTTADGNLHRRVHVTCRFYKLCKQWNTSSTRQQQRLHN